MSKKKHLFCVFSHTNWVADDFTQGVRNTTMESTHTVMHSLGLDVPYEVYIADTQENNVSYWVPSAFATQLQRIGMCHNLTSPGANFMSRIPEELAGRNIVTETLEEFMTHSHPSTFFIKPAEAKLDFFPADTHSIHSLQTMLNKSNLPSSTMVQHTQTIPNINWEHRLYILDGLVMTGSAYLIDNSTYYDNMDNPAFQKKLPDAVAYTQDIIDSITHQPHAYTLDVAWNSDTRKWFVLEANPAWCSGVYGANIEAAIHTIQASCNPQTPEAQKFLWKPDDLLTTQAETQPLLKIFR